MMKKTTIGPLGFPMPDEQARQLDSLLKTLPKDSYRKVKAIPETEVAIGERADISLVSVESVDRQGEVVLAKGLDLSFFLRNPVVTFAHKYDELPVGKAQWIKHVPGGVKAKTVYATRPDNWQGDWLPDAIFALTQQGVLRGKSIGFLATKIRNPTKEEVSRNPHWKTANAVIESSLLLEYAVAPIPVNQDALVELVSKGITDRRTLARLGLARRVDLAKVLTKAVERLDLDPDRIARLALQKVLARYKV